MIDDRDFHHQGPIGSVENALPVGNGRLVATPVTHAGRLALQLAHADYWQSPDLLEVDAGEDAEFGGRPVDLGRLELLSDPALFGADDQVGARLEPEAGRLVVSIERATGAAEITVVADPERDVLVVSWHDERAVPDVARLWCWRDPAVAVAEADHVLLHEGPVASRATWETGYLHDTLARDETDGAMAQCTVAAAVGAEPLAEADADGARLAFVRAAGDTVHLILATAVSADGTDPVPAARELLAAARAEGAAAITARTAAWWSDFWRGGPDLDLVSADGSAERFAGHWRYLVWLMAIANRGRHPVKFNGGLWRVTPDDHRQWGGGYWYYNMRDVVLAMLPAGRPELARNFFAMYLDAADTLRAQTRHLFAHGGLTVPETMSCDGAMYRRDRERLYVGPTWFTQEIFSTGLEVAHHLLQFARYTGDAGLRERAYPFVRDVVEFFACHLRREEDGHFHLYPANSHETWWHVKDDLPDLAGLRAVIPRLLALSEELDRDPERRPAWRELLDRLAPLPRGRLFVDGDIAPAVHDNGLFGFGPVVGAIDAEAEVYAPGVFVHDKEMHNCHPTAIYGVYPFQISGIGTPDRQVAIDTFRTNVQPFFRTEWAADVIVPALLGLAAEARELLLRFADSQWERGKQYFERYGKTATTLAAMLLQSHDGVLRVFPAAPNDWNGNFTLSAEGPCTVSARRCHGTVVQVEIVGGHDRDLVLANPWPGATARVVRDGETVLSTDAELLRWPGRRGVSFRITRG